MGLGFSVGSGVKLHGGSRGLGVSVGKGPLRYSTRIGGGSGRRSGASRTSLAAHEREVRRAKKLEEVQAAVDLDNQLIAMCQAHEENFEPSAAPESFDPEPVDRHQIKARLSKEAVKEISPFKLRQRREAKHAALEDLDAEVAAEEERRAREAADYQSEWERYLTALKANDPWAVLSTLERAFEDNEAPAAAVSCRDSRVDVVLRWPSLDDVVPERKAAVTPTGKPTVKKRTKGERAELYLEALSSNALATAKEAFAVCPSLQQVGLAVVRAGHDPARGDQVLEPIVFGLLTRGQLEDIQWTNISATAAFLNAAKGRVGMRGKGTNKSLFGLDLSDDLEEKSFIGQVADGLEARVPDDGIKGIPLPLQVVVG